MKTEMSVGNKHYLQNAMELNEEMQAILVPLLTAVENEAKSDTHAMLRTVRRLSTTQHYNLAEITLPSITESDTDSSRDISLQLEPAHAAINKSKVFIDALIENEKGDRRAVELSILSGLIFTAVKEIERIRGEEL